MQPGEPRVFDLLDEVPVRVRGWSMWPWLWSGDCVLVDTTKTIQVGQLVVVLRQAEHPYIHRIIELRGDQFLSRGDNRVADDGWRPMSEIAGVARRAKRWGVRVPLPPAWLARVCGPFARALFRFLIAPVKNRLALERRRYRFWGRRGYCLALVQRLLRRPWRVSFRWVYEMREVPSEPPTIPFELHRGACAMLAERLNESGLSVPKPRSSTQGALLIDKGRPVAVSWISLIDDDGAVVHDSYVVPSYRNQGLASRLHQVVMSDLPDDRCVVTASQAHNASSLVQKKRVGWTLVAKEWSCRLWPAKRYWVFIKPVRRDAQRAISVWQRSRQNR